MSLNVRLYPWYRFFSGLVFWQAIWFLFFQARLTPAEAILLYAIFDVAVTALEVPLGYMSDRVGRRVTLLLAALSGAAGTLLIAVGDGFTAFAAAEVLLGAAGAFASGTDSAFLYESLVRDGRGHEIERHELRAWRYSFTALALSALAGGALATAGGWLPFLATSVALVGAGLVVLRFREPPRLEDAPASAFEPGLARDLRRYLRSPPLLWLFALAVAMYGFSHVPFVFGQPFILEALAAEGLAGDAALVSGAVTAAMMLVSVFASWLTPLLRAGIGTGAVLLLALALQVVLIGALALTNQAAAIGLLLLRMVPNSLAQPLMVARVQPLLGDRSRATYLSLQSFCGRLLFAASLMALSTGVTGEGPLAHAEIRQVLAWYVGTGLVVLALLAVAIRALGPDD